MCSTRHFVYIFFNPVFQRSTAKNEINLFNNHVLIVAPLTFSPAGATAPSAEFLLICKSPQCYLPSFKSISLSLQEKKGKNKSSWAGLGGLVKWASDWRPGGRGLDLHQGRQHSYMKIDHEIFSTVILSLHWFKEGSCQFLEKECAQYWLTI